MIGTHKNSKRIKIMRKLPFANQQDGQKAWFDSATQTIGSYFEGSGRRIATGLNELEKQFLLPLVLATNPNTGKLDKAEIDDYYKGLSVAISPEGTSLEIGLLLSNDEPVSAENLPIEVEQYLKFRVVAAHPFVAPSEVDAKGNQLKTFFIVDEAAVIGEERKVNTEKDDAMTAYLEIKDKASTISMYLELLGKDTRQIAKEKQPADLRKIAESYPAQFLSVAKDAQAKEKFFITELVTYGLIEKLGNGYVFAESQELLGSDMKDSVAYFEDKKHSDVKNRMLALLKEAKSNKK